MKKIETSLIFILLSLMLGMAVLLSSCEEIIYEELLVEKIVELPSDTVYITKDSLIYVRKDSTITEKILVTDTCTLVQVVHDSIFIDREVIIHKYDTIWMLPYSRPLWATPNQEVRDIVDAFFTEALARGWTINENKPLWITYWMEADAPPESRSSYSDWFESTWTIKLKVTIQDKYHYSSIFRELGRGYLYKPYNKNADDILNPEFDPFKLTMDSPDSVKKVYLDKLFAN
jgi:hypothetical protein